MDSRSEAGMTTINYILAERGGFEPQWELVAPKSISSRSRYDHFGTSPHRIKRTNRLLSSFPEKIY